MKIMHPDIETFADVTEDQFNLVYAMRGWQKMDEPAAFANDLLGRFVRDVEDLTIDEARALLANRPSGEYPDEKASKEAVYAAYRDSFGDRPVAPTPPTETVGGIPLKAFDPSEHTVDEVHEHLAKSDEAVQILVLEAEESGKGRVTITNWSPPAPDDSAPGGDKE